MRFFFCRGYNFEVDCKQFLSKKSTTMFLKEFTKATQLRRKKKFCKIVKMLWFLLLNEWLHHKSSGNGLSFVEGYNLEFDEGNARFIRRFTYLDNLQSYNMIFSCRLSFQNKFYWIFQMRFWKLKKMVKPVYKLSWFTDKSTDF
jgi:hypothetical protein